jgi:vitamin B12 transporter
MTATCTACVRAGLSWAAQWSECTARACRSPIRQPLRNHALALPHRDQLRGYLWQNEWRQGAHRSRAALERREDDLQNAPIDRSRSQDALALGYGYNAGAHTLQLNVRHDDDSEFGGKSTGSAAYGYAITPHWRATASVGTAFRAPTLYQRFSEYGVATLQPRNSRNAELGLRYAQGSSSFSAVALPQPGQQPDLVRGARPCASTFGCYANTARAEYRA